MLPSYAEFVASISQLDNPLDPTVPTAEAAQIRGVADQLAAMRVVDRDVLAAFIKGSPAAVRVLGLTVGLSQEKLKGALKHHLGTTGWVVISRERPEAVIEMLDREYDLVRLLNAQRNGTYSFADVLIGRALARNTARVAGQSGRNLEDEIEAVVKDLGLSYDLRTRFVGNNAQDAPCDVAIPAGGDKAEIVVAAKSFGSTGSKQTAAVTEVEDMANKRLPTQFVYAVIDGVGWKSRTSDLRRMYELAEKRRIDGLFTLKSLADFRSDLIIAATRLGLAVNEA